MTSECLRLHATSISLGEGAVLIRGAPGSGKSSLALQLMETTGTGLGSTPLAARLIADDQSELYLQGDQLWVRCPASISGKLEVRGQGILQVEPAPPGPVVLVADLMPHAAIARLPEATDLRESLLSQSVARISIDPLHPAAASRLRLAYVSLCLESRQTKRLPA